MATHFSRSAIIHARVSNDKNQLNSKQLHHQQFSNINFENHATDEMPQLFWQFNFKYLL